MFPVGLASYGLATAAYATVAAMLLVSHPGSRRASWITLAAAVSAAWAAVIVLLLLRGDAPLGAFVLLDALHVFVWIACITSWLPIIGGARLTVTGGLLAGSVAAGLWSVFAAFAFPPNSPAAVTAFPALLVMALIGLLGVEQVFRRVDTAQRGGVRLLCLAIGGIFVTDIFLYSHATLLGALTPAVWGGRGIVSAAIAPVLLLAVKRHGEWERLFISRQVAFYTASLIGVGIYLLVMSLVAYVLRAVGGEWGLWLQVAFLIAALTVLVVLLFSTSIRARVRVFLVKHFYRNKYDYRYEWLRLTASLGRTAELVPLARNALDAIMAIIGSDRGSLWLERDDRFEWTASIGGEPASAAACPKNDPVVRFLAARDWVIDTEQYANEPSRYDFAFGSPSDRTLPDNAIIVPLNCQGRLLGFVVLTKAAQLRELNFEDHDILKTAGRQAAIVLAQALAQEQLAQTRQFEAVNKLSTFLMHDLKNLITQQELVVTNAQRFRDRKEFIDDAIETVRSGVVRMRKILEQLKGAAGNEAVPSRAEVSAVFAEVRSRCAERAPIPELQGPEDPIWVEMSRELLASCLTHLIRNAQDATPAHGRIDVRVTTEGDTVSITVQDTGHGMDEAFIRGRLFRPFDSTKGAKGMGIGAYQVREAVRAVGGAVEVSSEVGSGTSFRLKIPRAYGVSQRPGVEESAA